MTMRGVVVGLMGALMMVATGCSEECVDSIDCNNNKGSPGDGKVWACRANACVAEDRAATPTDAGTPTTPDSGTPDAGRPDSGTPDSGTPAGDMTIAEGGACSTTASCMAGLYCESAKCAPLHLVVTERVGAGSSATNRAVVVYYKAVGSATVPTSATALSEDTAGTSRYPRWSKDGKTVAFENTASDNTVALWSRTLPLTAGQKTELTTGTAAATTEFRYMEWAPSTNIAWAKTTGSSTTGISYLAGATGSVQTGTTAGVFPAWSADGTSFAYSASGQGLKLKSITTGSDGPIAGPAVTAEQPQYNAVNTVPLYLDEKDRARETISGAATPLTGAYVYLPASGSESAREVAVAEPSTESTDATGEVRSYVVAHTWSPRGTHIAYVRAYYFKPLTGESVLCNGTNCGGRQGNKLFVRPINPTTGALDAEIDFANEATLPSFSDDGYFLAYVSGSKLQVQKLNPAGKDSVSIKDGALLSHTWGNLQTNRGDDHRPRWQPR